MTSLSYKNICLVIAISVLSIVVYDEAKASCMDGTSNCSLTVDVADRNTGGTSTFFDDPEMLKCTDVKYEIRRVDNNALVYTNNGQNCTSSGIVKYVYSMGYDWLTVNKYTHSNILPKGRYRFAMILPERYSSYTMWSREFDSPDTGSVWGGDPSLTVWINYVNSLSVTASSATVVQGGSTNINVQIKGLDIGDTCTKTGNWAGTITMAAANYDSTNRRFNFTLPTGVLSSTGTYTFGLRCTRRDGKTCTGGTAANCAEVSGWGSFDAPCALPVPDNSCVANWTNSMTKSATVNVVLNGQCGTAHYTSHIYTQTESFRNGRTLCTTGTASPSTPTNPPVGGTSSWTCQGINGGSSASCQARRQATGVCGTAATNYQASDTAFVGTFCSTGALSGATPTFPATGSSVSWTCAGVYGGTNTSCTATRSKSPYELWIYRNRCSGNRSDTIDVVESNTLPINWRPDINRINMKTINGQTLCYEVRQNCSATNVLILGQQNRTYDCSIPTRLSIQPSSVDIESGTNQELSTSIVCSKGETIPVQTDITPANSINWGGSYSSIVACSPGTSTTYIGTDRYSLHAGNGTTLCTGNVTGTIANYIYNGFGWGSLTGNYSLNIRRGSPTIGGSCPTCGTKYMDVPITAPVMRCS